jgi:putative tributyrin esterase
MALISCDFYSDALEVNTSMTVLLPQEVETQIGASGSSAAGRDGAPVLYLLHGLTDDHTIWQRRTSIERYVEPLGLAVVMPDVHRSFYADEVHGHAYWTFLTQELPQVVSSFFRVSDRPEDTYVAGLSMGGYGALKWALQEPSRFAGVASMSGALDVAAFAQQPDRRALFDRVFGGTPGPEDDLLELLRSAHVDTLPPMYVSCGTEDERVLESNQTFVKAAEQAGIDLTVDFRPGEHEWGLWDAEIQKVLAWLPGLSS